MKSAGSLLRSLEIQKRVVLSLFIREMKTRFGVWRLGYIWILLEPLGHIGAFLLLFELGGRQPVGGMDFPTFLLVGLL
ncbi:MAG: ABC transporter permease, partial [Verrucomicrobiota bacterium]